jgi:hypothetical protein
MAPTVTDVVADAVGLMMTVDGGGAGIFIPDIADDAEAGTAPNNASLSVTEDD